MKIKHVLTFTKLLSVLHINLTLFLLLSISNVAAMSVSTMKLLRDSISSFTTVYLASVI